MWIKEPFYVTFGILSYSYIRGTECMSLHTVKLWTCFFFFLQKLDTVKEGILLELVLNIYICHLGQLEAKICPPNDTSSDPRFQRSKHGNNNRLSQYVRIENYVRKKLVKQQTTFFLLLLKGKAISSCHSIGFEYGPIPCCSSYKIWQATIHDYQTCPLIELFRE